MFEDVYKDMPWYLEEQLKELRRQGDEPKEG
jgi:hypothetical protein